MVILMKVMQTLLLLMYHQNVTINWICPDSIYVSWNTVSGATDYEVSMLGNVYMDSMTTTTATTALIINPNPAIIDSWFSVCAKVNGNMGRRAVAINAQPINSGCMASSISKLFYKWIIIMHGKC